jgi:GR25 family glycosyltransferase involved in LPS biosynthesis
MTELCSLAEKYHTDKTPKYNHYYTPEYHKILKDKKYSSMLEIGIGYPELMCKWTNENYKSGASLFMWRDYFKDCIIHGADIKQFNITENNIKIHQCDQSKTDSLENMMNNIGNVDFIIDDGSHILEHQILTFKTLNKYCNDIYIIEDINPENLQTICGLTNNNWICHSYKHVKDHQGFVVFIRCRNIPKIFYINLDERKDRREHMEKILEGYDYERVSAIKNEDGFIGCALSHILCIQIAIAHNYDSVIILEDDFMFHKNNNFNNIKLPDDYDIFLLCNRIKKHSKIDKTFSRVQECSWTSGHILDKNIYNDLIKNLEDGIKDRELNGNNMSNHLDIYWNKLWEKYKCISHNYIFATQKEGYSDIINEKINRSFVQNTESKFI